MIDICSRCSLIRDADHLSRLTFRYHFLWSQDLIFLKMGHVALPFRHQFFQTSLFDQNFQRLAQDFLILLLTYLFLIPNHFLHFVTG